MDAAGDEICRHLEPIIRIEVGRFLPATDPERDDMIQETLIAFLAHLRRAGRAPERPEAFVATMAGNRCRNLCRQRRRRPDLEARSASEWPLGAGRSVLDLMEERELEETVREGLDRLEIECRNLLKAIYIDETPMERLQREAGLSTVQGIYYRKYSCLKKLHSLLNPGRLGGHRTGREK
ncbi:MAG: sigma factor [Candidatus Eisenbacteria bacterium]